MRDPNYNPNPYDFQDYESRSLPYIPYASPSSDTTSLEVSPSNDYAPSPEYSGYSAYPSVPRAMPEPGIAPADVLIPGQFAPPLALSTPRGKKGRGRLWILLGTLLLLFIVVSVSTFALLSYLNRSTPTKTLDIFCDALQKEDYQMAYNQFSPSLQTRFTESDFAGALSSDKVAKCTHGAVGESGTTTATNLKLVHSSKGVNNDSIVLTKDGNNQWKINDLQRA